MPNNKVDVYVDNKENVNCVPDVLETGKSWRKFRLYWTMATDGYEICDITKPDGTPLDPNVFYDPKKNGRGWRMKNVNPEPATYEYLVHVRNLETGECIAHDPAVRNGGRK